MTGEFVVVAFPVVEYSETRNYTAPTVSISDCETLEDAQESAFYANLTETFEGDPKRTYEAMSRAEFNGLDWPGIELTYDA